LQEKPSEKRQRFRKKKQNEKEHTPNSGRKAPVWRLLVHPFKGRIESHPRKLLVEAKEVDPGSELKTTKTTDLRT